MSTIAMTTNLGAIRHKLTQAVLHTFPSVGSKARNMYWGYRSRGLVKASQDLYALSPLVRHGLFKGMELTGKRSWGSFTTKIIGSYEDQLSEVLSDVMISDFKTVIHLGCAEGYFLVGMARKMPNTRSIGIDIDTDGLEYSKELARINNVAHLVELQSTSTPESLHMLIEGKTFILCDVEGAEEFLLDPDRAPNLRHAYILFETHEHIKPGVAKKIRSVFNNTHDLKIIKDTKKDPQQYPSIHHFSHALQQRCINEMRVKRPAQQWYYLLPKEPQDQ